jgi:hypothetical protein
MSSYFIRPVTKSINIYLEIQYWFPVLFIYLNYIKYKIGDHVVICDSCMIHYNSGENTLYVFKHPTTAPVIRMNRYPDKTSPNWTSYGFFVPEIL